MVAFATPQDLANKLGYPVDTVKAEAELDGISTLIREAMRWNINEQVDKVTFPTTSGGLYVWLPTLLLTAVEYVKESTVELDPETDYEWAADGSIRRTSGGLDYDSSWTRRAMAIEVKYTHGYEVVPDVFKVVCLEHASVTYPNSQRLTAKEVGATSLAWSVTDLARIVEIREDPRLSQYKLVR